MGIFSKWFSMDKSNAPEKETKNDSFINNDNEAIFRFLNQIFENEGYDPLLPEAIQEIVCYKLGSTSIIQRSLAIGYNQAERLMEQMEIVGIVGEARGDQPREILVNGENEILPRLKMIADIQKRYKGLPPEEAKATLKKDLEVILSGMSDGNVEQVKTNISYKDLDDDVLSNLEMDENGFIVYPNGVKLYSVDGDIYYDNVIYSVSSKLGYNGGELYFTNHGADGQIEEDYTQATCMAYWEMFTDKLICLVRNDSIRPNYEFMRNCQKSKKRFYRTDVIFYRLKNRCDEHNISKDFLERVLNANNPFQVPYSFDKNKIVEALHSNGIEINMIKEIINKDYTSYKICLYGCDSSTLFDYIITSKKSIESDLAVPSINVIEQDNNFVLIEIPNFIIKNGLYKFSFGGENGKWLTDCLYNGYSMLTLTDFIDNDEYYRSSVKDYNQDDAEKDLINAQAMCYAAIDKDILQSRISINKFSDGYDSERINYIAMAAFYKQCDVLQDVFIKSTHGEYEILSKTTNNGITTTKIRAYHEYFNFINGHSMPEHIIPSAKIPLGPEEYNDCKEGYVYVMTNPSMEGQVKIGKTQRDPYERAKELSAATGVPTPFTVVFYKHFNDCNFAEKTIHQFLESKGYRISANREFFNMSTTEAIEIVQSMYNIEQKADNI